MKRCLLFTCVAFSLLLASASLHQGGPATAAGSGRIWHVSEAGNDLTGGGTQQSPLGMIQTAINAASHGDTVLVEKGTYVENINFLGKAILVASHFTFDGLESSIESTVIDGGGSGTVVTFDSGEDFNSVIQGFTITGGYAAYGGGILCVGSSPTIRENFVVENESFTTRGGPGIYCSNESHARIYRNLVARCTAPAAIVANGSCHPQLVNNTVCYNSWGGISIAAGSEGYLKNNIFCDNGPYGVHVSGSSFDLSYNDVFGQDENYAGDIGDQTGINGNISEDPLMYDPWTGDYHLTVSSPCIDAGDPADSVPPGGGLAVDMGAFEFIYSDRYVRYRSHQIDDSGGNNNGAINPGEAIAMPVTVENTGFDTAYTVTGTLRTANPYVLVTDSIKQYGDIPPYQQASSIGSYQFEVGPGCPDSNLIIFELELADGISTWLSAFVEVVNDTGFGLFVVPTSVGVEGADTVSLEVIVVSLGGFGSQVTLSHSGLPSGMTATFDPDQLIPTDTSVFTIVSSPDAEQGTFLVTITGSGGGTSHDTEFELGTFFRGDANGDGIIDVGDPLYILNWLFKGTQPPSPIEAGDANCNQTVDLGDAVYLLGYLFKGSDPPGCP